MLSNIAYIAFEVSYESAYEREPIEILYFKTSLGEKSSSTLIGRELSLTSLGEKVVEYVDWAKYEYLVDKVHPSRNRENTVLSWVAKVEFKRKLETGWDVWQKN